MPANYAVQDPREAYLARLMEIRKGKRASMSGSVDGEGADDAAPVNEDEAIATYEAGMAGGGQRASGRVPGRNRFSIGNARNGSIDLGSPLSARANPAYNPDDPLAPQDPFKPTKGVGGFFRRLGGDDANERNEMAAQQRAAMLRQKWIADQRQAGEISRINLERDNTMAINKQRQEFEDRQAVVGREHGMALERLRGAQDFHNNEARDSAQMVRDAQNNRWRSDEGRADRGVQREQIDMQDRWHTGAVEAQNLRALVGGGIGDLGKPYGNYGHIGDSLVDYEGKMVYNEGNEWKGVPLGGNITGAPGAAPGAPTPEQLAAAKAMARERTNSAPVPRVGPQMRPPPSGQPPTGPEFRQPLPMQQPQQQRPQFQLPMPAPQQGPPAPQQNPIEQFLRNEMRKRQLMRLQELAPMFQGR